MLVGKKSAVILAGTRQSVRAGTACPMGSNTPSVVMLTKTNVAWCKFSGLKSVYHLHAGYAACQSVLPGIYCMLRFYWWAVYELVNLEIHYC